MSTSITRAETSDLLRLVRQRESLAKTSAAHKAVSEAQAIRVCTRRDLQLVRRGQNANKQRRDEPRKMATTRIAAIEKAARTEIERMSLDAQTAIVAHGLQSDAAKAFLEKMPPIAELMPTVEVKAIEAMISAGAKP